MLVMIIERDLRIVILHSRTRMTLVKLLVVHSITINTINILHNNIHKMFGLLCNHLKMQTLHFYVQHAEVVGTHGIIAL